MNKFATVAALKYKKHFYEAQVDKPKGFQITLVLMGLFLMGVVSLGLSSKTIAIVVFLFLSLFFAIFPYLFPKKS